MRREKKKMKKQQRQSTNQPSCWLKFNVHTAYTYGNGENKYNKSETVLISLCILHAMWRFFVLWLSVNFDLHSHNDIYFAFVDMWLFDGWVVSVSCMYYFWIHCKYKKRITNHNMFRGPPGKMLRHLSLWIYLWIYE